MNYSVKKVFTCDKNAVIKKYLKNKNNIKQCCGCICVVNGGNYSLTFPSYFPRIQRVTERQTNEHPITDKVHNIQ